MIWSTAVVIGNGVAGKLAARVLADFFKQVIVLEQGDEPNGPIPRKGVPQSYHSHVLLKSGENVLNQLFPHFSQELVAKGSVKIDFSKDVSWFHHKLQKIRYDSGFMIMHQSRPFLEWHLQQRLVRHKNIKFIYKTKVSNYIFNEDHTRVIAVGVHEGSVCFPCDLLIDTTGSASITPKQLDRHGFKPPEKTKIKVGLSYASRLYKVNNQIPGQWTTLLIYPDPPIVNRGGILFPIEENRWIVTLLGYGERNRPPQDEEAFHDFSKSLSHPDLYDQLKEAEPISDIKSYSFQTQVRHHYEKVNTFPKGLIVMGDAICRFDPVFGQGMSAACLQAEKLAAELKLARTREDDLNQLTKNIHKQFSKVLDPLWLIVATESFRYPETTGPKPIGLRFLQWYISRIYRLATHDCRVYRKLADVLHLVKHPIVLFKPDILIKMFKKS